MVSNNIEGLIKEAQRHFNRREFQQFINPLIQSLQQNNRIQEREKINSTISNIIASSMASLKNSTETIEDRQYVDIEDVESILLREMKNYTI